MSELEQAKAYWRAQHSQSARVIPEGGEQDYRYEIAREIIAHEPTSVFEFGCASGRNLSVLRSEALVAGYDGVLLTGLDMNPKSLAAGRGQHTGIQFIEGDEKVLPAMGAGSFDIAFTVSVLDHIPDPEWRAVYDHLVRIARQAVYILEPIQDGSPTHEGEIADAPPFTWYHAYGDHDPNLKIARWLPMPTTHYACGTDYFLMRRLV